MSMQKEKDMIMSGQRYKIPDNILVKGKGNKYLVFNPNIPSWLVTNATGVNILKLCNGERDSAKIAELLPYATGMSTCEIDAFLGTSANNRLFSDERPIIVAPHYLLRSVHLNVTEACNLRCTYCYAEEREKTEKRMTLDDYLNVIRDIKALSKAPSITFTGGEPLVSPLLMDIAQAAKKMGVRTSLLTNGTLISKDNVKQIARLFDGIKISLDGSCAGVNDQTRGAGVFDRVMAGLDLLDSVGKKYRLSMTVTRKNIHDVGAMNAKFGDKLSYAPYFQRSADKINSELEITGNEYYHALTEVVGINPYSKIDSVITANRNKRVIKKCSIADGSLSIAANGDVFPCHLLHFEEFRAGNLFHEPLEAIYSTSPVLLRLRQLTVDKIGGCSECPISLVCGGGCVARHYYETGKIDSAGNFCEYEQLAILDALIDQYEI